MKAEAFKRIIDSYTGQPERLPEYLAACLKEVESIKDQIQSHVVLRQATIADHARQLAAIESAVANIRKRCLHWSMTFHGDPSGGNDSHRTCDICGAEL